MAWPRTSFDTSARSLSSGSPGRLDASATRRVAISWLLLNGTAVVSRQGICQLGYGDPSLPRAFRQALPRRIPRSTSPPPRARSSGSRPGTSTRRAAADRPPCPRCRRTACCGRRSGLRLRLTDRLAANRARVLERDGIPLLRHDAAALHEPVSQPQVAELARAPEQQILHDAAEAGEQHRRRRRRSRADSRRWRCCRRCCRSRPSKPRSSVVRARSIGNPVPVIAQAPSGLRFVLA